MNKKTWVHILSFIGLFVTFGIALGLDRWSEYLRQPSSFFFGPLYLLWTWSLGNIVLAICVFLLYTSALPKLDRWTVWCIVLFGLLINFVPVLYWLPLRIPTDFLTFAMTRRGYLINVGGLTAIAGIFTLFRIKAAE